MNLRHILTTAGLLSLMVVSSYAKDVANASQDRLDGKPIQLARYAKAFIGAGNVTVELAPYKSGTEEGAILLFKGIESPWDGRAIHHHQEPGTYGGIKYVTTYNGKEWCTLVSRKYPKEIWYLYVPEVKEEIVLTPSDGAAQLTNPRAIFQTYLDQQASGGK